METGDGGNDDGRSRTKNNGKEWRRTYRNRMLNVVTGR